MWRSIMEIRDILNEREARYGGYSSVSEVSQALKKVIRDESLSDLKPYHQESLDMICNKIARIICGDPEYKDSWADIAGYATLSADRCSK